MKAQWTRGNQLSLLENGEAFFPRVFDAIAAARHEVLLETFILFEDKVGLALQAVLLAAAQRGVRVDVTVDGYGSPDLSAEFIQRLSAAGVHLHVFDPAPRLWGMRTNILRRMHRKIVVVDGVRAFVGGINYSADHLADFGPTAKQDYAVEVEGPLVLKIRSFALRALLEGHGGDLHTAALKNALLHPPPLTLGALPAGQMAALFVTRDNGLHPNDIERHYRVAIRAARQRVVIANAYFFPGFRLLRELRRAAARGVNVQLILQGEPDMPIVKTAARLLYHHLLTGGVSIYEYLDRPLHGKVAVSDGEWSTVGSSNLDPLSLVLNLEANVIVRDRHFNETLTRNLDGLMAHSCRQIYAEDLPASNLWRVLRSFFVFHLLRLYPLWAGWLPAHSPRLMPAEELVHHGAAPSHQTDAR